MAKTHKYLKIRHHTYVLRVPVPKNIQSIIGKKEITRSLKTRDINEANFRYPNVLGSIQSEFALAKAQDENDTPVHLSDFEPASTAKAWLDRQMKLS